MSVLGARAAVRGGRAVRAAGARHAAAGAASADVPAAKRAFLALWGRRTVREAAACLYLSEPERHEYLAQGADPARLHPICRRRSTFPSRGRRAALERRPVVYLGQLHPIKRIDVLLDAFARVRAELPDARLEVVGAPSRHGEELRAARRRRRVAFRGLIPEEEKGRALRRSARVRAALGERGAAGDAARGTRVRHAGRALARLRAARGGRRGRNRLRRQRRRRGGGAAALLRDPARSRRSARPGRSFAAGYRREVVVPGLVALLERVATSSSSAA